MKFVWSMKYAKVQSFNWLHTPLLISPQWVRGLELVELEPDLYLDDDQQESSRLKTIKRGPLVAAYLKFREPTDFHYSFGVI